MNFDRDVDDDDCAFQIGHKQQLASFGNFVMFRHKAGPKTKRTSRSGWKGWRQR